MARKIRIEYAGAACHVMARGNRGPDISGDDRDRKLWLERLGETCAKTGWRIHAWRKSDAGRWADETRRAAIDPASFGYPTLSPETRVGVQDLRARTKAAKPRRSNTAEAGSGIGTNSKPRKISFVPEVANTLAAELAPVSVISINRF
jgi:hypothetical protein